MMINYDCYTILLHFKFCQNNFSYDNLLFIIYSIDPKDILQV